MINIIMDIIINTWNRFLNVVDKKIIKFVTPLKKCVYCSVKNAAWKNHISNVYACDMCVPRGCSCRLFQKVKRAAFLIQNYEYRKDNKGRDLPCEDWDRI